MCRPRRLVVSVAIVSMLAGTCEGSSDGPSPAPLPGEVQSLIGAWLDASGDRLPQGRPFVMDVWRGASHCGWQELVFLAISWPLGTHVKGPFFGDERTRMFVRLSTASDLPLEYFATTFDPRAELPEIARDTGYHRGEWHLWVSDARIDRAVWLVNGSTIERWPAMTEQVGCA